VTPEGLALAEAHDRAQRTNTAEALLTVAALFTATLDPADLDRTFRRYSLLAARAINDRRANGSRLAQAFYRALRALEARNPVPYPDIPFARPVPAAALQTSLAVTGPVAAKRRIAQGLDAASALADVLPQTLGSVSRHVENGGRETVRLAVKADPVARAYARRSSGRPCAFCAMLIGRGPVYKNADTGSFRCHDHCRCSAVPVFEGDEGWTEQAREFNDLWYDSTTRTYGQQGKQRAFFEAYNGKRPPARIPAQRKAVDDLPKIAGGPGRTIDEARLSNPHYDNVNGDPAYGVNCTHVAQTVELRARGYDVQATRLPDRFYNGIEGKGRNAREVLDSLYRTPDGGSAGARLVHVKGGKRGVDAIVQEWPEGARGQVVVSWKASEGGGGHIFNVEKRGGKAVYIEGQTSKDIAEKADASGYFPRAEHRWVARTDDLVIRDDANLSEFVVARGTKIEPPSPAKRYNDEVRDIQAKVKALYAERREVQRSRPTNSTEAHARQAKMADMAAEIQRELDKLADIKARYVGTGGRR